MTDRYELVTDFLTARLLMTELGKLIRDLDVCHDEAADEIAAAVVAAGWVDGKQAAIVLGNFEHYTRTGEGPFPDLQVDAGAADAYAHAKMLVLGEI